MRWTYRCSEGKVSIFVIQSTPEARAGEHCRKKSTINCYAKSCGEIQTLPWLRPIDPDQIKRDQPNACVGQDLPHHMKARVRRPAGIGSVRPIEVGSNGEQGVAEHAESKEYSGSGFHRSISQVG